MADTPTIDEHWLSVQAGHLPGSAFAVKPEWETFVGTVGGKLFALYGGVAEQPQLIFKGAPSDNLALRQQYPFIIPGYHMNKQHWNSLLLDESTLTEQQVFELLQESYRLVLQSLPKAKQAELMGGASS